jgi:hypothetical protein
MGSVVLLPGSRLAFSCLASRISARVQLSCFPGLGSRSVARPSATLRASDQMQKEPGNLSRALSIARRRFAPPPKVSSGADDHTGDVGAGLG